MTRPLAFTSAALAACAACAACAAFAPPAAGQAGAVLRQQKISQGQGGFSGPLHSGDLFGIGASALGDLDGDGLAELAVGAYFDDDGGLDRGAVWILFLRADGSVRDQQKISSLQGGFTGDLDDSDLFGWSVEGLGDLDGDGTRDVAVGAWLDDDGGPEQDMGAVWILFLRPDGSVREHQKISPTAGGFNGALDFGDRFGTSLAFLGDLDGDGAGDLAVGSLYDDDGGSNSGSLWILFLHPDGTVKQEQKISNLAGGFGGTLPTDCRFGYSAEPLGDMDHDGLTDLAVGAILDPDGGLGRGAVWLLLLDSDGTVKDERKISSTQGGFTGPLDDYDSFGRSIANLGDLDGDGLTDLAVGAVADDDSANGPGEDRGAVYVLFLNAVGGVQGELKISDTSGDFHGVLDDYDGLGQAATALGDLDLDGVVDIVTTAVLDDDGGEDIGAAWVLFLSDGTWNNPGFALAGAAGTPELHGQGSLQAGEPLTVSLRGAPAFAPLVLIVSLAQLGAPFKGGVLVPAPVGPLLPLLSDAGGELALAGAWPAGVPSGTQVFLQAWIDDAGAPQGLSASNALVATTP